LSLMVSKGSFFQRPAFGSRLHLLHRSKMTARTAALAVAYCKEALQWIIDLGRAISIDVDAEVDRTVDPSRLKLKITAEQADGRPITYETWLEVV